MRIFMTLAIVLSTLVFQSEPIHACRQLTAAEWSRIKSEWKKDRKLQKSRTVSIPNFSNSQGENSIQLFEIRSLPLGSEVIINGKTLPVKTPVFVEQMPKGKVPIKLLHPEAPEFVGEINVDRNNGVEINLKTKEQSPYDFRDVLSPSELVPERCS